MSLDPHLAFPEDLLRPLEDRKSSPSKMKNSKTKNSATKYEVIPSPHPAKVPSGTAKPYKCAAGDARNSVSFEEVNA